MHVAFRVDASLSIGSGHVMRCLTLAESLRTHGVSCLFICRDHPGNLAPLIRERGFLLRLLPCESHTEVAFSDADYSTWLGASIEADADQTILALEGRRVGWLVVDHYALDEQWESLLRPYCDRLLVIDDLQGRHHDCDLYLNQNLQPATAKPIKVQRGFSLIGPRYALLQSEYRKLHRRTPYRSGRVRRVLVYFGGADSSNLTGKALSTLLELCPAEVMIDVVVNPYGTHYHSVLDLVSSAPNVVLHQSLPSLAYLMAEADLAIGASGATSWERCCLGLPSVVFTLADNQIPIASELSNQGYVYWVGPISSIDSEKFREILSELLYQPIPDSWSRRCSELVDGNGCERVIAAMGSSVHQSVSPRHAGRDDIPVIRHLVSHSDWIPFRSDPEIFQELTASGEDWINNALRSVDFCHFLIFENSSAVELGVSLLIRLQGKWYLDAYFDCALVDERAQSESLSLALAFLRAEEKGALEVASVSLAGYPIREETVGGGGLALSICSDSGSWINTSIPRLIRDWICRGYQVTWVHDAKDLPGGELCFFLSYSRIVGQEILAKYAHGLVVHASDLPKGRGWSPTTWLIIEGADRIPVTLLEAVDSVDAGSVYDQRWIQLDGTELVDQWRSSLAEASVALCEDFVSSYPNSLSLGRAQLGEATYYPRRRADDSELNIDKPLRESINLLRVVDNKSYPAFFQFKGKRFYLRVSSE